MAPHVTNSLVSTFRLLILIGATVSIVRAGGLPTDWFVAFSALGGAAVGFASTKTIGNFIAGLYLFMVRPFKVGDYVRVGTVEGMVKEITINYSKILTIGNNVVLISNLQILDRDITNFSYESEEHENLICYTFEIGLSLNVSTDKIAEIFKRQKHAPRNKQNLKTRIETQTQHPTSHKKSNQTRNNRIIMQLKTNNHFLIIMYPRLFSAIFF